MKEIQQIFRSLAASGASSYGDFIGDPVWEVSELSS